MNKIEEQDINKEKGEVFIKTLQNLFHQVDQEMEVLKQSNSD